MRKKNIIIVILFVAALFRLIRLGAGDTVNDEVFYAFRGLSMMDFDAAPAQTTPWEWFGKLTTSGEGSSIPWWMHLSFHDHPPLVFAVQGLFMKIFGESAWAFRLPSALLGIITVYLIYLIGKRLYSENAGLIASGLYAVTLNSVYIFRTGLQEPYVIFFMVLASYLFLRSLEEEKYLVWTGIVLGLGFLTKYTMFIMVPVFLLYLVLFNRRSFASRYFWIGTFFAIVVFSPVLIYNMMLYKTFGHFDFQFSFIAGQNPEVWQVAPGKEIGSLKDRLENYIPRNIAAHSGILLIVFILSFIGYCSLFWKEIKAHHTQHAFVLIAFVAVGLLMLKIGPSYRFLTMLTPFMVLMIGAFRVYANKKFLHDIAIRNLVIIIFIFEIFYSWNNQIRNYPIGEGGYTPLLASKVRYENYNWGYKQLGDFFEQELQGKMPAISFDMQYQFLQDLRDQALDRATNSGAEPYPALIVYDGNFDTSGRLWNLDRLHYYHAWPLLSAETYFKYVQEQGSDYFERTGFRVRYFVFTTNSVLTPESTMFETGERISIKNPRGDEAFVVYKKEL
ncbi:MAG: glycosyltransferase family 39 protein [bacterium]|nr:glycosyltransferase family 39 protein [bacterium]